MSSALPLLRLNAVTKRFGGLGALTGVSCQVSRGQIVGIIGPNGAGKTTLFNVITGALPATSGTIMLDGEAILGLPPHRIVRRGIARTFQNIRLFASMTVWEHMLVPQAQRGSGFARVLPIRADRVARSRAQEVLRFLKLEAVRDRAATSLPYGVQRKVEIARALTLAPKLLLLDEPVGGMNQEEAEEIRALLVELRANGVTILLIEHDMPFVMNLCQYLYVLDFGALIAEGAPASIRRDARVLDAYLGTQD
jgi:branched-chain amino acid transport system ATP-binding protein